jgi:hypothetical protein
MKATVFALLVTLGALGALTGLEAHPLLYHFSGRVSQIEYDDAGLVAARGLQLGSPVAYTYLVDFQRPGSITRYDGSIEVLEDIPRPGDFGNLTVHAFFADLLEGTFLRDDAAEQLRPPNGYLDVNAGLDSNSAGLVSGWLSGGGVLHHVSVYQQNVHGGFFFSLPWGYVYDDPTVQQWQVGEHMLVVSSASNAAYQGSLFRAEVTLDRITAVLGPLAVPVPEPGSLWLLATGAVLGRTMHQVMLARRRQRHTRGEPRRLGEASSKTV